MLIIPDVHGRKFWVDAIEKYPEEKVIFLGDYIDPYPIEGITPEEALEVFKDILERKKSEPDRITLLIGNHDLMYMDGNFIENSCRHDWNNHGEIIALYKENKDLFKLGEIREGILFSHSGIHPGWLENHPEYERNSMEETLEYLNSNLWDPNVLRTLSEVSYWRGGYDYHGSPVWSDVREWLNEEKRISPILQVFGHTQLNEGKTIIDRDNNFACIDCKKVFNEKLEIVL